MAGQKPQSWEALERTARPQRAPRMAPIPESRPEKSEKVPLWIVVMFIFALAFCLFAVYKAFIYKQGYDFLPEQTGNVVEVQLDDQEQMIDQESGENSIENADSSFVSQSGTDETSEPTLAIQEPTTPSIPSAQTGESDRSQDMGVIKDFYQHMVANKFDEMNALVQGPLLRSKTWKEHWNQKNLGIFSRNLVGELNLDNLFFIANSVNSEKRSRQYSYSLSYTIQPNHQFKEDWKITLVTEGTGKVLISEIMCETKGCSRSPFFWPQNLGLK